VDEYDEVSLAATTTIASLQEPAHRGESNVDHRQFAQRI
jgi:hypothetical protein